MPYIGTSPSQGVRRVHTYTATANQTSFSGAGAEGATLSYKDSNFVDVYQNGVKLGDADYTATSGTAIVLGTGATVSDLVVVVAYDVFSAADTVSKADGGQFDGNITMAGTLAVTGAVTANAGVKVDNITIDGTEIDLSSGALTIDVADAIVLDSGTGSITLKDGGTNYGQIAEESNSLKISSLVADGDITFTGNDGGSGITALTLDMSDAGTAIFNHNVKLAVDDSFLSVGASDDFIIYHDGTDSHIFNSTGDIIINSAASDEDIIFKGNDGGSTITALTLDMSEAGRATFNDNVNLGDTKKLVLGAGDDLQLYHDGSNSYIQDTGTGQLRIDTNGTDVRITKTNSEYMATFNVDAAVELYYDNSKRLETTANGVKITGSAASDTALEITAGDLVYSGASNFDIKHTNDGENITFSATPSGGSTTQYMRLESDGRLKLGTSDTISAGLLNILFDGTNFNAISIKTSRSATGSNFAAFVNSSNGVAGLINHNGSTSVNYSTSSDYRLKENVNYSFDATTRLKQLKPCRFNFIADGTDKVVDGFLAHEVSSIVPEAITGEKDAVDDNNAPIIQQIDQSKLIPLLTKTLQEQQATIEALTARIETLENA